MKNQFFTYIYIQQYLYTGTWYLHYFLFIHKTLNLYFNLYITEYLPSTYHPRYLHFQESHLRIIFIFFLNLN